MAVLYPMNGATITGDKGRSLCRSPRAGDAVLLLHHRRFHTSVGATNTRESRHNFIGTCWFTSSPSEISALWPSIRIQVYQIYLD